MNLLRRWRPFPLLAAALSCASSLVHADVLLEYADAGNACHGDFARVAMSGARMRVEPPPPGDDYAMVYDGAEKLAVTLDARNRSYVEIEMDADALDYQADVMSSTSTMIEKKLAAVTAMNRASANDVSASSDPPMTAKMQRLMEQSMRDMPKEQREQMQNALQGMQVQGMPAMARSEPQIETTSEGRTIGGIACSVQRVMLDGELQREECVAAFDALGLQPAELARLRKSMRNFEALTDSMSKLRIAGISKLPPNSAQPTSIAIERRCYAQGRQTGSATLSVSRPTLAATLFEIPADYQRMDIDATGADER